MTLLRTAFAAASAAAFLAVPASAQTKPAHDPAYEQYAYDDYDDDIIVVVPGGVRREQTDRSASGVPINTLTTSQFVHTSDLDLRYESHVEELHRRIRATARDACDEIDRAASGVVQTSDGECMRDAVRDAMAEAEAMVYAARS